MNPASDSASGARIASVTSTPIDTLGGLQVFARWLNAALTDAGYAVQPVSRPRDPWMSNPALWASLGEPMQIARVSRALRDAGPFDAYIVHGPCAFAPGPGLTIMHINLADYAREAYAAWHPNRWKLHAVNMNLESWMSRAPRLNVAVSRAQAEGLRARGVRVDEIIYAPVDTAKFSPAPSREQARHELGWTSDVQIALTPGRVARGKGWDRLIELARQRPLTKFYAPGPRPDQFPNAPPNFVALGVVPHDRLPLYYRAADLTLLLSSAESYSLVVAESLSCETAVMLTPTGLGYDLLEEGGALAQGVVPFTPDRDLKVFDRLMESPELREEMGLAGREFVLQRADGWVIAKAYRELMERALK